MVWLGVDNMCRVLLLAFTVAGIAAASAAMAAQPLKVSVSGEPREEISTAAFLERYGTLAKYVGVATGADIRLSYGRDLTRELQRTRSRAYDLMIGPAHVIGSAIRYGYEPVARFEGDKLLNIEAPDLPSERDFVALISRTSATGKEVVLELTPEQRTALPVPAKPPAAAPEPEIGPVRAYPPLEPN